MKIVTASITIGVLGIVGYLFFCFESLDGSVQSKGATSQVINAEEALPNKLEQDILFVGNPIDSQKSSSDVDVFTVATKLPATEELTPRLVNEFEEARTRFYNEDIDYEWSFNIESSFSEFIEIRADKDSLDYALNCRRTMCELTFNKSNSQLWNKVFNELKSQGWWYWPYSYLDPKSVRIQTIILEK